MISILAASNFGSPLDVFTEIDSTLPSESMTTGKTASVFLSPSVTKTPVQGAILFWIARTKASTALFCELLCSGDELGGSTDQQGLLSATAIAARRSDFMF
jgi:hypothetical protein